MYPSCLCSAHTSGYVCPSSECLWGWGMAPSCPHQMFWVPLSLVTVCSLQMCLLYPLVAGSNYIVAAPPLESYQDLLPAYFLTVSQAALCCLCAGILVGSTSRSHQHQPLLQHSLIASCLWSLLVFHTPPLLSLPCSHQSSHFYYYVNLFLSLDNVKSVRIFFWMNSVRNLVRDSFGGRGGLALETLKARKWWYFFFKINCFKKENEKCFWKQLSFIWENRSSIPLPFSHHLCLLTPTILETKQLLHLSCKPG